MDLLGEDDENPHAAFLDLYREMDDILLFSLQCPKQCKFVEMYFM